jgi:hypothetical protein
MNTPSDQFARVIEPKEGEVPEYDDGYSPIMPFPTSYELTREQEADLVNHAMSRKQTLELQMGRDVCAGSGWYNSPGASGRDAMGTDSPSETWIGKRVLYDLTYRNDMRWRVGLLGGIFAKTNLVVPAARRICRQMIARAVNYFFATSPWFSAYPVGAMDRIKADQTDRYARWKMDQAKLQRTEEQAVERAFILGEAVIKTTWANRQQFYKTDAEVLVDADGNDILGADGDYIMKSDKWILDSVEDPEQPGSGVMIDAELMMLERDGVTPQPPELIFLKKKITRRIVHYKGPEAKVIQFRDFLCPLEAESVQEADCVVHIYDKPVMELADEWKKAIPGDATAEERMEANRKAVQMLRMIGNSSGDMNSAQNSEAVDSSSGEHLQSDQTQPIIEIGEFHLRYDADGDGLLEDVFLVIDLKTRTPIFYDYEANITPDGLRPFSVVRVNEVPGRWYGLGAMEMFQTSQEIVDLWMNRRSFASSASGRVTFWDPSKTKEGTAQPNLQLNGGMTYTLNTGAKAEEALSVVYLDDNKIEDLQQMIEFFLQLMMNESGVTNANDGNVAGMESTKLATGIRNIEKSGQELFGLYLGHLEPGISESLEKMIKILFANMDQMEVYRYFESGEAGGEDSSQMMEINPGDIANLQINTRILLTRRRGEQVIESNARTIELVEKFYSFPFLIQKIVAPKFIAMAKEYQCADADKLFIPVDVPIVGPTGPVNSTGPTPQPRQLPAAA